MLQLFGNHTKIIHLKAAAMVFSLLLHAAFFYGLLSWLIKNQIPSFALPSMSAQVTFSAPKSTSKNPAVTVSPSKAIPQKIIRSGSTKKSAIASSLHNHNTQTQTTNEHSEPSANVAGFNGNGTTITRAYPLLMNGDEVAIPYPPQARARRVEGIVKLKLTVATSGEVISADIISGPAYGLRQAALLVARKLFFLPATDEQGEARIAQIEHEVVFRLTSS